MNCPWAPPTQLCVARSMTVDLFRFHNSAEIDKSVNLKMSQHTFYNHMDAVTLYCDLDPDPSTASWKAIRFFLPEITSHNHHE